LLGIAVVLAAGASARELTSAYVITAVANKAGLAGTDWHTDLTIYNPQSRALEVTLIYLPGGQDNSAGGFSPGPIQVHPWETLNLWDVLGPNGFAARGQTGAMLVYTDHAANGCPATAGDESCDFALFARNYTLAPYGGTGEFGQDFPGFPAGLGVDWTVIAYMPQIMDDSNFRTNVGVASWTNAYVTVREDVQDASGNVIGSHDHVIPPYGQTQWRLEDSGITGGTVAAYVVGGSADALVYPYATVVNWTTGDATTVEAQITKVGLAAATATRAEAAATVARSAARHLPPLLRAPVFSLDELRQRRR
jgi:hypothetical protein